MRVRHRARDLQHEKHPRRHVEPAVLGEAVERLALDELEREPGLAVVGDAGVIQPRDVRVLERREDLALARQALGQPRALPRAVRQLQRDAALLQQVGALGQPHAGHAAAAELADEPVGADPVAGAFDRRGQRRELVGLDELGQRGEQRGVAGGLGMPEQRAQARRERAIGRIGQGVEPAATLRGWQRQRVVEQRAQTRPLRRVEVEARVHRMLPSRRDCRAAAPWRPSRTQFSTVSRLTPRPSASVLTVISRLFAVARKIADAKAL